MKMGFLSLIRFNREKLVFIYCLATLRASLAISDNYKSLGSYYIGNIVPQSQLQPPGSTLACFAKCSSLESSCSFMTIDSSSLCSFFSTSSVAYSVQLAPSTNTTAWKKINSSDVPIYVWTTSYDATLAHYWPIQSGTMYDVIQGAHMTSLSTIWASDRFNSSNSAIRVNPSVLDSYYTIPGSNYLNGGSSFSVVFWIRTLTCASYPQIFWLSATTNADYLAIKLSTVNASCKPFVEFGINTTNIGLNKPEWVSSERLFATYWTQLAVTYNSVDSHMNIFINATQTASANASSPLRNVSRLINYIGTLTPNSHMLNGELDDIKFYDRTLVQSDLLSDLSKTDPYLIPFLE